VRRVVDGIGLSVPGGGHDGREPELAEPVCSARKRTFTDAPGSNLCSAIEKSAMQPDPGRIAHSTSLAICSLACRY